MYKFDHDQTKNHRIIGEWWSNIKINIYVTENHYGRILDSNV